MQSSYDRLWFHIYLINLLTFDITRDEAEALPWLPTRFQCILHCVVSLPDCDRLGVLKRLALVLFLLLAFLLLFSGPGGDRYLVDLNIIPC